MAKHPTAIQVAQYDLSGELVAVHKSLTEAAKVIGVSSAGNIAKALDTRYTTKNSIWRSVDGDAEPTISVTDIKSPQSKHNKGGRSASAVAAYNDDGVLVAAYDSVAAAAIAYENVSASLYRSLRVPGYKTFGLFWRRVDDLNNPPAAIVVTQTETKQRLSAKRARLSETKEYLKSLKEICFIVDGQPGDEGYYSLQAAADVIGCTREAVRLALLRGGKIMGHQIAYRMKL